MNKKKKTIKLNVTNSGYKATVQLKGDGGCVIGTGRSKDDAVDAVIKSMIKKIDALEKEVKTMYNLHRYVRAVVTGEAGC